MDPERWVDVNRRALDAALLFPDYVTATHIPGDRGEHREIPEPSDAYRVRVVSVLRRN